MPLIVQNKHLFLNQTATCTFPDTVLPGYYVVGISSFSLNYTYPSYYNVRRLGMSLAHGQKDQHTIFVTLSGYLQDDNGHSADIKSQCSAVVMAWVGSAGSPTLLMQNVTGVSSSNPKTVSLPQNAVEVYAFLSGLQVELPAEQGVTSFAASTSANSNPIESTISITGGSVLNGVNGTVDVGLLVNTSATAPYQLFTQAASTGEDDLTLNFNPAIGAVATPIMSFGAKANGLPVILMNAGSTTDQSQSFPTSSIPAPYWGPTVLVSDHSTPSGNINALVVGVNSA
jgi:hypothetical protein